MQRAIGVDVGATKIASAIVTRDRVAQATRQTATRVEQGADMVIRRIADEINALMQQDGGEISGIGVGVPGLVNPVAGVVIDAANMRWQNIARREQSRTAHRQPRVHSGIAWRAQRRFDCHTRFGIGASGGRKFTRAQLSFSRRCA